MKQENTSAKKKNIRHKKEPNVNFITKIYNSINRKLNRWDQQKN